MKITKYGHCCLLIEHEGKNFLTDPGAWSTIPSELPHIDFVLITHEHQDHLHTESLLAILSTNPEARVLTNTTVGKILSENAIAFELISDNHPMNIDGILLEFITVMHAEVYLGSADTENTGFFIDNKLFYPGDAFTVPDKSVDVLAAPVAGPWVRLKSAIEYVLEVKPRIAFPVHDGQIKSERPGPIYSLTKRICKEHGIDFIDLHEGGSCEV